MEIIGRLELVDLPELHLERIEAKIDTGAYRSAIHYKDLKVKTIKGKETLIVTLDLMGDTPIEKRFTDFKVTKVKSSFGDRLKRYFIRTKIKIGHKSKMVDLSFSDRSDMRYPILIGRKVLAKTFLVDVSAKHLHTPHQD
ncbi:ATP-dependent zinc protease family protein [Mangrovivirga cuniculi]|uniref:ATP-dependent zinc protease n=1 Tax=Mangrovivirga cuniculi TaxID=2715131 RepID=A0A4D7JSF0_9BACT|nr:RimK/LysX family protein [Mangrovivirga cuniculi]QCK16440.1 ATP-dependent zinc protease [Mangrovivirga cuniculi]